MKDITKTIIDLATFNSWRRGEESIEMPSPMEIGLTIDTAVNIMRDHRQLLKDYDELKQKHGALKKKHEAITPKLTQKNREKQLIQLLCDKGGFVLVRCEKDWGGTYGWTTKSNPNFTVNGYKTEELARRGFIEDATKSELAAVMLEMLLKYYDPEKPCPN